MARTAWEKKFKEIQKQYPDVVVTNWDSLLRSDPDIFAKLLGDILKFKGKKSVPGKRPNLTRLEGEKRLAKMADEDFAEGEFVEAFKAITANKSMRSIANKTGLGRSYIQRLLTGEQAPTYASMEIIAKAYGKDPSYFLEYRIARILVVLDSLFRSSPETASAWYLKVVKNGSI